MGLVFIPASTKKEVLKTLSHQQYAEFEKSIYSLKRNCLIGDPIHPYGLRELKYSEKRVYFFTNKQDVLILGAGKKRIQQQQISGFKEEIPNYAKELQRLSKQHSRHS